MRHLTITEYGHFVGCSGNLLQIKANSEVIFETPLSRLRSINIAKEGVSLSSNLIMACANRGVRIFILDWRGIAVAAVSGQHQHAVANLRKAQFQFFDNPKARVIAAGMIYGKLRNQRATLLYFNKYLKQRFETSGCIEEATASIAMQAQKIRDIHWDTRDSWREEILGYEGAAANQYWNALKVSMLIPSTFVIREGRGAKEITNQLLNYGYTLLSSYLWSALDNAGFELYYGILHTPRPGKPALVLDMMEEYRSWVVDRNVIKLRALLDENSVFDAVLKKKLGTEIHKTMSTAHPYKQRRLKLESIIQRQAYRLAAAVVNNERYQPYRFKW